MKWSLVYQYFASVLTACAIKFGTMVNWIFVRVFICLIDKIFPLFNSNYLFKLLSSWRSACTRHHVSLPSCIAWGYIHMSSFLTVRSWGTDRKYMTLSKSKLLSKKSKSGRNSNFQLPLFWGKILRYEEIWFCQTEDGTETTLHASVSVIL